MAVSHVKSVTIADGTNTNIVRPGDWNSVHNQFFTLAGNTNNASSVSGTNVILSGGNNVTLVGSSNSIGFSVGNYITTGAQSDHSHGNPTLNLTNLSGTTASASNGLTISLSAAAAGGGGGATISGFDPFGPGAEMLLGQLGQSTLWLMPIDLQCAVAVNQLQFPVHFTAATGSTGSYTISQMLGLYTKVNATQISRAVSWQVTTGISHNGTQNSASNVGGIRTWAGTVAATTLDPGCYWAAFGSKTASAGANATISHFIASNMNTAVSGALGAANNASHCYKPFQGSYSAQTAGLPDTVGTAQMRGSAAVNLRPPLWCMYST
jgi:hypothetical protein